MDTNVTNLDIQNLKKYRYFIIYHKGENEYALVIPAQIITPKDYTLFKQYSATNPALYISSEIAKTIKIKPVLDEVGVFFKKLTRKYRMQPKYTRFLFVDLKIQKTGSRINDKVNLIKTFVEHAKNKQSILSKLVLPGHFRVFVGHKNGLKARDGHTELSLALMQVLGYLPLTVMTTLWNPKTGKVMNKAEATEFARQINAIILTNKDIKTLYFNQYTPRGMSQNAPNNQAQQTPASNNINILENAKRRIQRLVV